MTPEIETQLNSSNMEARSVKINILDIPIRDGHVHTQTWDTSVFETLSTSDKTIPIKDMLDAYTTVMRYFNLDAVDYEFLETTLLDMTIDNAKLVSTTDNQLVITEYDFFRSLKYFYNDLNWRINVHRSIPHGNKIRRLINWHKYGEMILTSICEMIITAAIVIFNISSLDWATLVIALSALCSFNMACMILTYSNAFSYIDNYALAKFVPTEYISGIRVIHATKLCLLYVLYAITRMLQIRHVLDKCKNGCTRSSIHIVEYHTEQVIISWRFFLSQISYWGMLPVIIGMCVLYLSRKPSTRYLSMVLLIVMYCIQQYFDKTNSKAFYALLPILGMFSMINVNDIYHMKFGIRELTFLGSYSKLPIIPKDCISTQLMKFNCLKIDIKNKHLTNDKWNSVIITHDNIHGCAYIITNKPFVTAMDNYGDIYIGSNAVAKCRLYSTYSYTCVFCKDSGLYAFLAMLEHRNLNNIKTKIKLIWIITNISVVADMLDNINSIQDMGSDINITIFFSPHHTINKYLSQDTITKFSYLQCAIHYSIGIDILTHMKSISYCILHKLDIYATLNNLLLTMHSIGECSTLGIFVCGDDMLVQNVQINVDLLNHNYYGIHLDMWADIA